eukprot:7435925-Lingulodinium_polyedra.AAC.1
MTGPSLQLIMTVEANNGYEAWRLLVRREEPTSGSAQVAQLTALLQARFSGKVETFVTELTTLENRIREYEQRHVEVFPDSVHQALLKSNAPPGIKDQVELA